MSALLLLLLGDCVLLDDDDVGGGGGGGGMSPMRRVSMLWNILLMTEDDVDEGAWLAAGLFGARDRSDDDDTLPVSV